MNPCVLCMSEGLAWNKCMHGGADEAILVLLIFLFSFIHRAPWACDVSDDASRWWRYKRQRLKPSHPRHNANDIFYERIPFICVWYSKMEIIGLSIHIAVSKHVDSNAFSIKCDSQRIMFCACIPVLLHYNESAFCVLKY